LEIAMKLYTRTGASTVDDQEHGTFEAGPDGGFDFPDELSNRLRIVHIAGQRAWEDEGQRHQRLVAEELERRKDPASLYDAVQALTDTLAQNNTPAEKDSGARRPRRNSTSS
jgi:hypothetical protein